MTWSWVESGLLGYSGLVVCSLKSNRISKLAVKGVNKWLRSTSKQLSIKFIKMEIILSVFPEGINRFPGTQHKFQTF